MKKHNIENKEISWFIPLVLFCTLCILILGISIYREIKEKPEIIPPVKIEKKEERKIPVAIIIDDMGWNKNILKSIEEINQPLTLSFLPKAPYSETMFEELKHNSQFELILHLPLQPIPPAQCFDRGLITTEMNEEKMKSVLDDDLKGFYPYVKGLNNHMGSEFTSNEEKMKCLLENIKDKNMFFVDSWTSKNSCGYNLAKKMGIKTARRDVFLDNKSDSEYIEKQLSILIETAKQQGKAIGIGHAKESTISVLKNKLRDIENRENIKIVPVSDLLE
jgi:uncharacterized protein